MEYESGRSTAVKCEVDVSYSYQQNAAAVNSVPPATHVIPATVLRPQVRLCSAVIYAELQGCICQIFTGGGQSFDWRLATIAGMEVAKLVPWNSLLN